MSDREVRIVPPNQTAAFQQWAFRRVEDSLADFDGQSVSERLTRALQAQAAAREAEQKRADVDPQVMEAIRADAQKAGYEEGLRLGREEAERELKANVAAVAWFSPYGPAIHRSPLSMNRIGSVEEPAISLLLFKSDSTACSTRFGG